MRTHSKLQWMTFSGVITAALTLTATQNVVADNLRTATSADSHNLRSVPGDAASGIHQVSYSKTEPKSGSTARRYGQSSNRAKRQSVGKTSGRSRSGLQLAQHTPRQQTGQIRQVSDEDEKKPGFLKRFFGIRRSKDKGTETSGQGGQASQPQQPKQLPLKKSAQGESSNSDDNPYVNSGQPVARLPPPPPISYETNSRSTYNSGVPAKPAGYNNNKATPMIQNSPRQPQGGYGQNQGGYAQPRGYAQPQQGYRPPQENYGQSADDIPTLRTPANNNYQPRPAPAPRPAPRHDNFIDPFDNQGQPELLDLDSIARDPRGVASAPANPVRVQEAPKEELLPELPVQTDVVSQEPPRGPANGPYTGYRLDSDEQLLIQPNVSPASIATESVVRQPKVDIPAQRVDETPDITLPIVEEEIKEPELPAASVEPEAAEPMALEPVELTPVAEPVQDSVPLLDESEMDFPTHQQLEEDFHQLEETKPEPVEEAFETRTFQEKAEIAEPELPGANRLRALDTRAKQEQQRFRIMARSGKFGFKGFCPVALRDTRELIDSRERYKAKFGLQAYYFSSPEAKTAFEANPARYAPAAGGSDVVLLVNTGEDTPGSLDFSLWYRDRLYMFRSRETQAIFAKDPLRFADQY